MLGERLAELRKLNDDTQQTLADKLGISVWSIRAWEQGKSYPFSNVLLAICKLYGTSADYLLGLTDIDPSDEARKQRQRLTEEEQNEKHFTKLMMTTSLLRAGLQMLTARWATARMAIF